METKDDVIRSMEILKKNINEMLENDIFSSPSSYVSGYVWGMKHATELMDTCIEARKKLLED